MKKLWDEILAEDTTVMVGTDELQIVGTKYKKAVDIFSEDEVMLQIKDLRVDQ